MDTFLTSQASMARLVAFGAVLVLMMLWEVATPRRRLGSPRLQRWPTNLGLSVINTIATRLFIPLLVTGAALYAQAQSIGLLNSLPVPLWLSYIISLLALDLLIYAQHVLFHRLPILWCIHRMHHADTDLDVTSGVRFHPFEILLSAFIKMGAVIVLGAPAGAVILFEIVLNAMAMFNHANIALPERVDLLLRRVIVTPDMHRVHHSVIPAEHHRNFGFNLSIWDKIFGTYQAQPRQGHIGMKLGLAEFPAPVPSRIIWNLLLPFQSATRETEQP